MGVLMEGVVTVMVYRKGGEVMKGAINMGELEVEMAKVMEVLMGMEKY